MAKANATNSSQRKDPWAAKGGRIVLVHLALVAILCLLILLSLGIGSAGYPLKDILEALFSDGNPTIRDIVLNLRFPRIVNAILIGSSLAVSGVILQAVMQNPLADPGIIGVSSGAATAATTILLLFPNAVNFTPLAAFVGGLLTCLLIFTMAYDGGLQPTRIVLSGVAINAVLGGYISLLQILYSDSLSGVLSFLNGNIAASSWVDVKRIACYAIPGMFISLLTIRGANALQLGDEFAQNLGFRVVRVRILLSAVAAFLAAATVATVGLIGFVGLIVPHICRVVVGADHKKLIPTSLLMGAVVAVFADLVGRVLIPGIDLPLGIVMSVFGGPYFLYMLRKQTKGPRRKRQRRKKKSPASKMTQSLEGDSYEHSC